MYRAQDDDRVRNLGWAIVEHTVSCLPGWHGRYETDCHADERTVISDTPMMLETS